MYGLFMHCVIPEEKTWSVKSNYIFIHELTHGFNGLRKDNSKRRRKTLKFFGFDETYIKGLTMYHIWRSYLVEIVFYEICIDTVALL